MQVRRYGAPTDDDTPPFVLVYALFNRPEILDLTPDRSVIRTLLDRDSPVYVVEWGSPTRLDGSLDIDDYVHRFLANAIRAISRDAGHANVHLIGYSTGGTLAAMYAAVTDRGVGSLSVVAAPIGFDTSGGLFDVIDSSILPEDLVARSGVLQGPMLSLGFSLVDPPEFLLGRYLRLYDVMLDTTQFTARGSRISWSRDSVDVPSTAMATLVEIFRGDELVTGTFHIDGTAVDLSAIDIPVAAMVGQQDRFVPNDSTRALLDAVGTDETNLIRCDTGHLGLATDNVAFGEAWPALCRWLATLG